MNQTISIGKQDFVSLRENHYFYIDKTDFIRQWWENADDITLITRPRRFGKTLNMNMLNCFFSRQYEKRGDLFKGLSIWTDQRYQRLQGSYPVIFISFADVKQNNYKDAIQKIKNIISNPNGVIKFNITIQTDSFSSSSVKSPVFKYSSVYDIKLSKLGILTSFSDFEFFNFTDAVLPVEEIFILSTSLLVIFVTSSEYVIFELLFSIIDDNSTITITPIINHMANVFIPFFI